MIQGLKKDHAALSELLLQGISTIQETLLSLCKPHAQYSTIHSEIIRLNVASLSLLTLQSDSDVCLLLSKFKNGTYKIHDIAAQLIPQDDAQDFQLIYRQLHAVIDNYHHFLQLSSHTTSFHASPYSTPDVIVVGFDNYDQQYALVWQQLMDFKQVLLDWHEEVLKRDMDEQDIFMDDIDYELSVF